MNPIEFAHSFMSKGLKDEAERESDPLRFVVDPYRDLTGYARTLRIAPQTFIVQSHKSLALPSEGEPADYTNLLFSGEFVAYNKIIPPRYLGEKALNGLCLSFSNVVVLPFEEPLPDMELHVPIDDVQAIEKFAA